MLSSSPRKVFIRTDANPTIAFGHVMRSLSLADALSDEGFDVEFVTSDDIADSTIGEYGYANTVLHSDWQIIEQGIDVVANMCDACNTTPLLLIDTYSIEEPFVSRLADHADVCYLGSKKGFLGPLSLLANYSTNIDEACYHDCYDSCHTRLLLGTRYAPLRRQFWNHLLRSRTAIEHVLITTGSTDPHRFVPALLQKALSNPQLAGISFDVIIGPMFADADEIRELSQGNERVVLHKGVQDMASLMDGSDVAVSANGTTVYELAAVGVPTITFAMVEEQIESAEALSRLGAVDYAGLLPCARDAVIRRVIGELEGFIGDPARATAFARTAHGLIDGKGAQRIAEEMAAL